MDFSLEEEHEMIRDSAREYAERVLKPASTEWDRAEALSDEGLAAAAEAGFMGLTTPEENGGTGFGNLHSCLMLEEINRWDAGMGVTLSVHNSLVCSLVARHGSEDQKGRWLPRLACGELLGAYCLTEPQAGSDAASIRCRAEKSDGGWTLKGTKSWVTSGDRAGLYVVYAVTDPDAKPGYGIGAFLVPASAEGVRAGKKEEKLGIRSSTTTEVLLENVFVPETDVIGDPCEGFKIALDALDGGRLGIASQALGIHRACLEDSLSYAKEREQFGKPIAEFQAIAWKLADMATSLDASRLLVHRAAWLRDQGEICTKECSMAKLAASRACNEAAQDAVQIHGGAGYTTEFRVEKYFRDARITEIYEGATDIQRLVISRKLLR
ncbi:MAG TPA: acyl-CoA dehydrogenase [Planctomycetes bacterium]|nr:acyl-CoA dehydrogenase [Planctomycetota bacterium]